MKRSVHTRMHRAAAKRVIREMAVVAALCIAVGVLFQAPAFGQVATSSLMGTVVDKSGAVIPGANVALTNEAEKSTFNLKTNSSGFFNFVALIPGTYTVTVSATGMATWEERHIVLGTNESRTLPNIALQVATTKQEVTVVGAAEAIAPLDTGETHQILGENMVSDVIETGRDAAELMKLMPGMAQSQWGQGAFNSITTATNTGPVGMYSANGGQPYGSLQLTVDGGVIVDTGNMGTQTANVNQDMTQELSIRNSSFDAEYANGPIIVNATGKGGGSVLHGEGYIYARGATFNAEDSALKAEGIAKPNDHYWYPGFNIGGPILIPGTSFNKNRDKLFFWGGFEYMIQHPEGSLSLVNVPTAAMMTPNASGFYDWSTDASALGPISGKGWDISNPPCYSGYQSAWDWSSYCGNTATGGLIQNGMIPSSLVDPNGLAYMKLFPAPNLSPASHFGYNYGFLNNPPTNRYEIKGRVDYNITQNTRVYFSYDRQHEIDINYLDVWWNPGGAVPYPSDFPAIQISNLWAASLTHVFGPSLTNETTFNYTNFINPVRLANPSKALMSTAGMNITLPYNAKVSAVIPNNFSDWTGDWSNGSFPMFWAPGFATSFDNGAFGALKRVPGFGDNLAWVKASHTLKLGFSYQKWGNEQTAGTWEGNQAFPQGAYEYEGQGAYSSGNPLADELMGHPISFDQYSLDPTYNLWFNNLAFYVQDQWKTTRRLTIDVGIRFDHEGQWYPVGPNNASGVVPGEAVWDPALCTNARCSGANLPGITWNALNSSIPLSGFGSAAIKPDPRIGFAYDLRGNGNTVLRAGMGVYRYQLAYNSVANQTVTPLGIQIWDSFGTCYPTSMNNVDSAACKPPTVQGQLPASSIGLTEYVMNKGDNRTPYTVTWNFMIDRRLPLKSTLEIGYVGSSSRSELTDSTQIANVNKMALGGYFAPDPLTGKTWCYPPFYMPTGCTPSTSSNAQPTGDYTPYAYGSVMLTSHNSYANYNALQATWQKQSGRSTFMLNYTYSKTMGIRDGETDNGGNGNGALVDPYNLHNNYGVLAYDRPQIFNAAYVFLLPDPVKGSSFGERLAKGIVNGWELSGITQYQSGQPFQPNTGGDFSVSWPSSWGAGQVLGETVGPLLPSLVCNPGKGLAKGQYFNPNCFAPTIGQGVQGPYIEPTVRGPAYGDSDLGLYKNFKITERQKIQFRIQATNFLNHPLRDFTVNSQDDLLSFNSGGKGLGITEPNGTTYNSGLSTANVNPYFTGRPLYTTGRRVMMFSLKYMF